MNRTLLLIILVVLLLAVLPTWPYSTAWSYYPSGGVGSGADHRPCSGSTGQSVKDSVQVNHS
jgi:hypothetical protein